MYVEVHLSKKDLDRLYSMGEIEIKQGGGYLSRKTVRIHLSEGESYIG